MSWNKPTRLASNAFELANELRDLGHMVVCPWLARRLAQSTYMWRSDADIFKMKSFAESVTCLSITLSSAIAKSRLTFVHVQVQ